MAEGGGAGRVLSSWVMVMGDGYGGGDGGRVAWGDEVCHGDDGR